MPDEVLTPRSVLTLKPAAGRTRTAYFDRHPDAPAGFALRVSATARAFYLVTTNRTTKQKLWVKIGDARQLALDAARRAATARAGEIALHGLNPNDQARERRAQRQAVQRVNTEPTVAELVSRYIAARRLSSVTLDNYQRELKVDIAARPFGQVKARAVIRADVREFLAPIEKRAPVVRDHVLSLLSAAFRWALDEEQTAGVPLLERDPTRGLELVARRRRRTGHLSDEQIGAAWLALEKLGVMKSAFVRLVILLGFRRGEAHAALWRDVDLEGAVWRVPTSVRKIRTDRKDETPDLEQPLAPLAVQLLRELREVTKAGTIPGHQGHPGPRGRVFHFSIGMIGDEMKSATGLQALTIHDLRRTMSKGLERIGAPPHVMSMALGHSGARAQGVQASDLHYILGKRPAELRTWLERWAEHVARLVEIEQRKAAGKSADVVAIRA